MRQVQFPDSGTSIADACFKDWAVGFSSLEANLDTLRKKLLSITWQCQTVQTTMSYSSMGDEEVRQPQGGEVIIRSMGVGPTKGFLCGGIRNRGTTPRGLEVVLVEWGLISWHDDKSSRVDGELPTNRHSLYRLILTHYYSKDLSPTLDPDPLMTKHFPHNIIWALIPIGHD